VEILRAIAALAALAGLGAAAEGFRGWSRRRFVDAWAKDRGLELLDCRHRFFASGAAGWLTGYDVRWREGTREHEGRVVATGLLRRKAWLDETGSGRGLTGWTPAPTAHPRRRDGSCPFRARNVSTSHVAAAATGRPWLRPRVRRRSRRGARRCQSAASTSSMPPVSSNFLGFFAGIA
jgi:hypothetical protein